MNNVTFHDSHRPALETGNYQIEIKDSIVIETPPAGEAVGTTSAPVELGSTTQRLVVTGERYSLKPTDIQSVFPPKGNFGDYALAFPHIILTRSTLPWERHSQASTSATVNNSKPWLALLSFVHPDPGTAAPAAQETVPVLKQVQWEHTVNGTKYHLLDGTEAANPTADTLPVVPYSFTDEVGSQPSDLVNVIDVPKSVLANLLPTANDIGLMAHTRTYQDNGQDTEVAVVLGNRLPTGGRVNEVHLVSLEGFFENASQGKYNAADNDRNIRLISLHRWSFSCADPSQTFVGQLQAINQTPTAFRLPKKSGAGDDIASINERINEGKILLPHYLREGSVAASWYRGPLVPNVTTATATPPAPVNASDYLLQYDSKFNVLDATYAAAWELGRQLMLENQAVSVKYYNWRRNQQQAHVYQNQQRTDLPFIQVNAPTTELPTEVQNWLNDLALLRHLPFNYLVPKEALLPEESIRFFYVDPLWMTRLLDGALSIGRSVQEDGGQSGNPGDFLADNTDNWNSLLGKAYPLRTKPVQGFLLRSSIVTSRFHFEVKAYNTVLADSVSGGSDANLLTQLRLERLSDDIMLGLFYYDTTNENGQAISPATANNNNNPGLNTLDFYLKPEVLHFGMDEGTQSGNAGMEFTNLRKQLRNSSTGVPVAGSFVKLQNGSTLEGNNTYRTVKMYDFAQRVLNGMDMNSADFAFQMIEGVEKVRFARGN